MRSITPLAMLLWLAIPASAAPLTYDQALAQAEASAPSLAARAAQLGAARRAAQSATALPDPKLEVGIVGFPVSGPNAGNPAQDDFSSVRIGYEQDMPNAAKRRARATGAAATITTGEAALIAERRAVRLGAALAWIDLYFAQAKLAALDRVGQQVETLVATAPARLASGSARPAQAIAPLQARALLGDARAALVADAAKARAALRRWTGGDTDPGIAGTPPPAAVDAVALRAALPHLPELRAADAVNATAAAEVDVARAAKRPDWSWQVGYDRRNPQFGDMVSAGVKVELPFFARTRQDPLIAARELEAQGAQLGRAAVAREATAALDSDLAEHAMHHDRLMRARSALLPLAERRAALETTSYAAGSIDLVTALDAQVALAEARLDLLTREADVVRDAARLNLTYGSDDQ